MNAIKKGDVERPLGYKRKGKEECADRAKYRCESRSGRAGFKESSSAREENTARKAEGGGEHENPVPRN